MLTQDNILNLYSKYWNNIDQSHKDLLLKGLPNQGMGPIEGFLVYFLVLEQNPRYAIELGPRFGYSTWCIGLAMKALGKKNSFTSFELQPIMRDTLIPNLQKAQLYPDYTNIIYGDARHTVVPFIQDKLVDFMWIDAEHSYSFAQMYISTIFPLLQPGCVAGAHDMTAGEQNNNGKFNLLEACNAHELTEEKAVKMFLHQSGKNYAFFHAITGGKHSNNKSLPRNIEFYNKIYDIVKIKLIAEHHSPQSAYWRM